MQKAIIGKKVGMTQLFLENGEVVPVTVIEAGPCIVTQKKTVEGDGYEAVQLGFGDAKPKHLNKPLRGHFDKKDVAPKRYLKEFRFEKEVLDALNIGDLVKADTFSEGDKVDITGTSKGKGFAGVIKRHGFSKLKQTHGTHKKHRHPGSIGSSATPSKVAKGKKMPGHMGHATTTAQNLLIAKIDEENNLIAVKGAVPGPKDGIVYITDSIKA